MKDKNVLTNKIFDVHGPNAAHTCRIRYCVFPVVTVHSKVSKYNAIYFVTYYSHSCDTLKGWVFCLYVKLQNSSHIFLVII